MSTTQPLGDGDPFVTIGISTFDRVQGTFPAALRSALGQDYESLEVVVCDNGSTDGTEAFMGQQSDARLRYHRHEANIGANANFNACLALARGTYFLLLHDDDLLEPGFIRRAVEAIGDGRPGVALGGVRRIDGLGASTGTTDPPPAGLGGVGLFETWFRRRCSFYFCSTLFHAERLRARGGFSTPEDLFQDVAAIAHLVADGGYVSVPGIAGSFRRHEANRGRSSHALRWVRDSEYLLGLLRELFPDDAEALHALGAPYLTAKCYRYVEAIPSPLERWRLYREIAGRFDNALAPWQYLPGRYRSRLRGRLARAWRRFTGSPSATS
jgi:glycosyltransferase involved in cell wall biosynthesis